MIIFALCFSMGWFLRFETKKYNSWFFCTLCAPVQAGKNSYSGQPGNVIRKWRYFLKCKRLTFLCCLCQSSRHCASLKFNAYIQVFNIDAPPVSFKCKLDVYHALSNVLDYWRYRGVIEDIKYSAPVPQHFVYCMFYLGSFSDSSVLSRMRWQGRESWSLKRM